MRVTECEMLRPMALARMNSVAALYGNSAADIDKGGDAVKQHYEQVMSYLPYLQVEATAASADIDGEREQAIERFRKWRDSGYQTGSE